MTQHVTTTLLRIILSRARLPRSFFIVKTQLSEELSRTVGKQKARVVDLCCGVGFSTRALQNAFPDAETVLGIDTSPEMVRSLQKKTVNKGGITHLCSILVRF